MSAETHQEVFKQEAYELLTELEESLLDLENDTEDMELVARIFRAMHTIKGSGAMFGFENIATLVHDVETAYDLVRNGNLKVSQAMLDESLKACDIIKVMLEDPAVTADSPEALRLINFFKSLQGKEAVPEAVQKKEETADEDSSELATYRIHFRPDEEVFMRGVNPALLIDELCELGESTVIAQTSKIPFLDEIEPQNCYTAWDVILTTSKSEDAIKDVFIFVEDDCELRITHIDDLTDENPDNYKKIGEILTEKGAISKDEIERILSERKMLGEILIEKGLVNEDDIQSAIVEQKHIKKTREKKAQAESASSIRVPSEKLDSLVDLVGELVTVQARLNQTSQQDNNPELNKIAEEVERLVWELRDNTMSIRMLPIGSTFSKFKRLVRDLCNSLGKEVDLVTVGAETELDKTVIEKLNDPLVHLIRNSMDHGLETPEERLARGKSRKGMIRLSAKHSGDSVLIQIADDGKGIDPDIIKAKAVEKGIISENADLTEKEIFDLLFASGFSTAQEVSNVSGRGVGMDVVRKNIEALRGHIEVDSKLGEGTTITLKLPLTLAIIDGLLIQIADQFFIIPLSIVQECIELKMSDLDNESSREIIRVRGELVPYVKLRETFTIEGESPKIQQIVVTEIDKKRVGFVVDSVIGDHQTVIKSLGKAFKNVDCISGATVLGDGSVALIIDVMKIYGSIDGVSSAAKQAAEA